MESEFDEKFKIWKKQFITFEVFPLAKYKIYYDECLDQYYFYYNGNLRKPKTVFEKKLINEFRLRDNQNI